MSEVMNGTTKVTVDIEGFSGWQENVRFQESTAKIIPDFKTLSLVVCQTGCPLATGYRLNTPLLIQVHTSYGGVLALTYLDTEEYGWGNTCEEAVLDLLSSLVEYLVSLEERQDRLAESGRNDLAKLRHLIVHDGRQ